MYRSKFEIDEDSFYDKKKKNNVDLWILNHNDIVYYFNSNKSSNLSSIKQI